MRGIDVVAAGGGDVVVADLARDADALAELMDGADAVVHLAAIASETDFDTAVDSHIRLTHGVLEAAIAHPGGPGGVHEQQRAVGFTARTSLLPADTLARPDSFYGFGKAACEALCSLYHSRHGLAVACLRIGSFRDRPTTRRHLFTWLSPGDTVRLVDACLRSPDLGFPIAYGISRNARGGGTWTPLGCSATSRTTTPSGRPRRSSQAANGG